MILNSTVVRPTEFWQSCRIHYQFPGVDHALDLLAELCSANDLGAQEVPGSQVAHVEVLLHATRLKKDNFIQGFYR